VYECVPWAAIDHFIQLCVVCNAPKPQNTRVPLKPIVASGFMSRGQVCVIINMFAGHYNKLRYCATNKSLRITREGFATFHE